MQWFVEEHFDSSVFNLIQFLGDSGSGLFFNYQGRNYLKGIVSASLLDRGKCNVNNYAIFTNVFKFTSWIKDPHASTSTSISTCGVMSGPTGLIQGGIRSTRTDWPWACAIKFKNTSGWELRNTGTLISERHVISRLASISDPRNVWLIFGAADLTRLDDDGVVQVGASAIKLHPDFDNKGTDSQNKLMIIVAKEKVKFSKYVSPICIWTFGKEFGQNPFAVGYGYDENGVRSNYRKHALAKFNTFDECSENYGFDENDQYFCAETIGPVTQCNGDDPLYLKKDNRWYVRGIMSLVWFNKKKMTCVDRPAFYTDLSFFLDWINMEISQK